VKPVNPITRHAHTNTAMRPRTTVKYCTANCSNGTANGCYITCGVDGCERRSMSLCNVNFDAVMCNNCKKAKAYNSKEVRCVTGEIRGKEDSCNRKGVE
jgi:hypothetical protein